MAAEGHCRRREGGPGDTPPPKRQHEAGLSPPPKTRWDGNWALLLLSGSEVRAESRRRRRRRRNALFLGEIMTRRALSQDKGGGRTNGAAEVVG